MICEQCAWEADVPKDWADRCKRLAGVPVGHDACKGGTHCFCQHRKPSEEHDGS